MGFKFCPMCGEKLTNESFKFCPECGYRLDSDDKTKNENLESNEIDEKNNSKLILDYEKESKEDSNGTPAYIAHLVKEYEIKEENKPKKPKLPSAEESRAKIEKHRAEMIKERGWEEEKVDVMELLEKQKLKKVQRAQEQAAREIIERLEKLKRRKRYHFKGKIYYKEYLRLGNSVLDTDRVLGQVTPQAVVISIFSSHLRRHKNDLFFPLSDLLSGHSNSYSQVTVLLVGESKIVLDLPTYEFEVLIKYYASKK